VYEADNGNKTIQVCSPSSITKRKDIIIGPMIYLLPNPLPIALIQMLFYFKVNYDSNCQINNGLKNMWYFQTLK
jgi:hypothetical protein